MTFLSGTHAPGAGRPPLVPLKEPDADRQGDTQDMTTRLNDLRTILISAYVTAMLATSVAPIRSDATLASALDPNAASKALAAAVSGVGAAGWQAEPMVAKVVAPEAQIAVAAAPLTANPAITDEQLARLVVRVKKQPVTMIGANISRILGLGDGTAEVPVKQMGKTIDGKDHVFMVVMKNGVESDQYIFAMRVPSVTIDSYLTDKSASLRLATRTTSADIIIVPNDQAATGYNAELALMASLADKLPPTGGTTVASSGAGS